ncbi:uncharacterized protein si:dkeyp-117h8.4 [Betta splendens]|uniref:Uncharacterized protein si:dkeyp-117h8.4 n=1 Tax=Betta splendens TaxID=158456 RepID=A0A6P7MAR5_BETSP|nr:uncharacterized protein si:dkeyp-117h8.4 [Betta splendens]XP_029003408.1 uncharacterized protein si:dkeyp-117h8.4 [Betta splendens]
MDFSNALQKNGLRYKKALDRIIDKYSKLQYHNGGIEVDLENTNTATIGRYMEMAELELSKLESKSSADSRDESLRSQDTTRDSQLDFTFQSTEFHDTPASTRQLFGEDDGMAGSEPTQLTVSLLHESGGSFSETEIQPEDQDEELQMTLRSHNTLGDLYPSMISRIETAWHRNNVSQAADAVLTKYRKWRKHSRSNISINTSIVSLQHSKERQMTSSILLPEDLPERGQYTRAEYLPRSPLKMVHKLQDRMAQQQLPGRQTSSQTREQHKPILSMDFYEPPETSRPQKILLNKTFSVPDLTLLGEQSYSYHGSPSRPCYPTANAALQSSLWNKRLSLSAHKQQAAEGSVFASENNAVNDRHVYSSPVRQSPSKMRMLTSFSGSPRSFYRSPKESRRESFSRETAQSSSVSTFLSSPLQKPTGNRILYPQHSNHTLQLPSLQSASPEGRVRLRRHLFCDSSQPVLSTSHSPKQIDEDFKKLYHKFVCQNKSFYNIPPCRLCAERSRANQSHSSSVLAALALSPHRSVLRKRQRESGSDSRPHSKRSREEYYTYSPGSKRRENEVLGHCLPSSQLEHHHDRKRSVFQNVGTQHHSADARRIQGLTLSGYGM